MSARSSLRFSGRCVRLAASALTGASLLTAPAGAATVGACTGAAPFRSEAEARIWITKLFAGLSPERPQPKDYFGRYFAPGAFETLNGARVEFPALKGHFDEVRGKAAMIRYIVGDLRVTCDGLAESHRVEVRLKTGASFGLIAVTLFRLAGGKITEIVEVVHKLGEQETLGGLAPK